MYTDCVYVVLIALCSALVAEFLSYLIIYSRADYKVLKKTIEQLQRKLDRKKEEIVTIDKQKAKEKKVAQMDENLKARQRDMASMSFRSTIVAMLSLVGVVGLLNNLFDGQPVAKLPFTPFPFVRTISHRNLPGDDYTDCSMMFIYTLCSLAIRQNVQKFLGFAPPPGAALFSPPELPAEKPQYT